MVDSDLDSAFRGELEMKKLERQMAKGPATLYDIRDRLDQLRNSVSTLTALVFVVVVLLVIGLTR